MFLLPPHAEVACYLTSLVYLCIIIEYHFGIFLPIGSRKGNNVSSRPVVHQKLLQTAGVLVSRQSLSPNERLQQFVLTTASFCGGLPPC